MQVRGVDSWRLKLKSSGQVMALRPAKDQMDLQQGLRSQQVESGTRFLCFVPIRQSIPKQWC